MWHLAGLCPRTYSFQSVCNSPQHINWKYLTFIITDSAHGSSRFSFLETIRQLLITIRRLLQLLLMNSNPPSLPFLTGCLSILSHSLDPRLNLSLSASVINYLKFTVLHFRRPNVDFKHTGERHWGKMNMRTALLDLLRRSVIVEHWTQNTLQDFMHIYTHAATVVINVALLSAHVITFSKHVDHHLCETEHILTFYTLWKMQMSVNLLEIQVHNRSSKSN